MTASVLLRVQQARRALLRAEFFALYGQAFVSLISSVLSSPLIEKLL